MLPTTVFDDIQSGNSIFDHTLASHPDPRPQTYPRPYKERWPGCENKRKSRTWDGLVCNSRLRVMQGSGCGCGHTITTRKTGTLGFIPTSSSFYFSLTLARIINDVISLVLKLLVNQLLNPGILRVKQILAAFSIAYSIKS